MADVVLRVGGTIAGAVIGFELGGPAGALKGAATGYQIGATASGLLFPPKLKPIHQSLGGGQQFMTASYGTPLGIIYGTARKQINLGWGQPIETHTTATTQSAGGKGGGQEQEVFTDWKSATFAGWACEGPALGVLKSWFNGELVYNKGVDSRPDWFLASRDMHIMLGEDDQQPSSIMESYEGAGNVPAYRGSVGVLLDTLALGPSGQRIPNIELEIARTGTEVILVPQEWITLPDGEEFYDSGLSDPYRVSRAMPDSSRVWMVLDSGGNPRRLALFNSFSQVYDITLDFDGNVYIEAVLSNGSALVAQEGGTAEGLHFINTVGGDDYRPGSDDFTRYMEMGQAGDVLVVHINQAVGGHQLYTVDVDVNPLTKTAVSTGKFLNSLFAKPGAYSGRVYATGTDTDAVTSSPARVGYVDDAGAWNTLVNYNRNGVITPGIVGQSYFYVRSGNTGEANVIEKRSHAGALVDSIALSTASSTGYGDVYQFSLNADESYLYVKQGTAIWKVATGTMEEELDNASAGSTNEQFIQGSAYQGNGVMVTQIGTDPTVLKIVPPDPLLDPEPPDVASVVEDLITRSVLTSGDVNLAALEGIEILGYVLDRPVSIAEAINTLRPLFFFDLIESDYKIKAVLRNGASLVTVPESHLGARSGRGEVVDPFRITRIKEIDLPRRLTFSYIDKDKDYQTGTQSTGRLSTTSQQEATIAAPVVMTSSQAAKILERGLNEAWAGREPIEIPTSKRYSLYEPGDVWTLYNGQKFRITEKLDGANGLIQWKGVPHFPEAYEQDDTEGVSNGGGQALTPLAPTEAFPLDIHLLREEDNQPGEYWIGRGLSDNWDGTRLYKSYDDGTSYDPLPNGLIAAAAGIGSLTEALDGPPGERYEVFDYANVITARMRPGVEPASYTRAQVLAGTAIPLLIKPADGPGEITFYQTATNTAPQIWEFSGLLRGRGGTEPNSEHDAGELVVLLDSALLSVIEPSSELNIERLWKAPSIGSTLNQASPIAFTNTGARLKPLAGRHLGGGFDASGALVVGWTPGTRAPDTLHDHSDAPVFEAFERYEIDVHDGYGGTVVNTYTATTNAWTYTDAEQIADFGAARDGYWLSIYQMSDTVGRGYPLSDWAPAPAGSAYSFFRLHSMTTTDTRQFTLCEFQLIDADGVTIVSAGIEPTTNGDAADFTQPAANLTDGNLATDCNLNPDNTPAGFAAATLDFALPYPYHLAGCKQGGTTINYYLTGFVIAGSNDGVTYTDLATFAGLAFPGGATLSSLYTI